MRVEVAQIVNYMPFYPDEIYKLAGRDDKVAVLDFREGCETFNLYGPNLTVVFVYSQFEREKLEKKFKDGVSESTHGKVKVRFLTGRKLSAEQKTILEKEGINSEDITSLIPGWVNDNLFYEEKTRSIRTIQIPMRKQSKGGDYNWMYGFTKRLVRDGIGITPDDREWYLAMKKYFEEEALTEEELSEMNSNGTLRPEIEEKYLEIKLEREEITADEEKKYEGLLHGHAKSNFEILKKEINSAGLSLERLMKEKPGLFNFLLKGTVKYIPEKLNVMGKKAIYLDWKGFLHVFLRHVREFEIGEQAKEKTKFLWTPDNISMVMGNVIKAIDEEIQEYFDKNPGQRFSRYGDKSLYFEGDYYTFHIEADGRVSTFHSTKKRI